MFELALLGVVYSVAVSCAAFYLYGERRGILSSSKAKDDQLSEFKQENAALLNRVTLKETGIPVFDAKGNILVTPPGYQESTNPVMFTLKPPIAAAQEQWEAEEMLNRPPAMSDVTPVFVPALSEEEKAKMRATYTNGNRN